MGDVLPPDKRTEQIGRILVAISREFKTCDCPRRRSAMLAQIEQFGEELQALGIAAEGSNGS